MERFAQSLGLPGAPKIKFLSKEMAKKRKNASRMVADTQTEVMKEKAGQAIGESEDDGEDSEEHEEPSSGEEEEADKEDPATSEVTTTKAPKAGSSLSMIRLPLALIVLSISDGRSNQVRPHVREEKSEHPIRPLHETD